MTEHFIETSVVRQQDNRAEETASNLPDSWDTGNLLRLRLALIFAGIFTIGGVITGGGVAKAAEYQKLRGTLINPCLMPQPAAKLPEPVKSGVRDLGADGRYQSPYHPYWIKR